MPSTPRQHVTLAPPESNPTTQSGTLDVFDDSPHSFLRHSPFNWGSQDCCEASTVAIQLGGFNPPKQTEMIRNVKVETCPKNRVNKSKTHPVKLDLFLKQDWEGKVVVLTIPKKHGFIFPKHNDGRLFLKRFDGRSSPIHQSLCKGHLIPIWVVGGKVGHEMKLKDICFERITLHKTYLFGFLVMRRYAWLLRWECHSINSIVIEHFNSPLLGCHLRDNPGSPQPILHSLQCQLPQLHAQSVDKCIPGVITIGWKLENRTSRTWVSSIQ